MSDTRDEVRKVVVTVPATSANVGVGYDCLGLALDLPARFTFEPARELLIDGCEERFRGEDNLVWTSYLETCKNLLAKPIPLHITIDSPIPLSGGLGSSSTCVVAGVALCVLAGFTLGQIFGEVGIGTIITAFFMGPLIELFNKAVARPFLYGKQGRQ